MLLAFSFEFIVSERLKDHVELEFHVFLEVFIELKTVSVGLMIQDSEIACLIIFLANLGNKAKDDSG